MTDTNNGRDEVILDLTKNYSIKERLDLALKILGIPYANTAWNGEQLIFTGLRYDEETNTLYKIGKSI